MAKKQTTKKTPGRSRLEKQVPNREPTFDLTAAEVDEWFEEEEEEQPSITSSSAEAADVAEKYARSQLRVVRETKDFTLDYLQHALKLPNYIINVAPDYQRRQRWSAKKRSLLIESFLMNIPIPPVFLFEREYNLYEVVDGRQRLDALREFLDNSYSLTGLSYWKELNGKTFNKLPLILQRGLIRRSIGAIVLLAETRKPEEDDFDVRTVLFDRLNTGGEKLNPQELRNALYPGPFNKLLMELARSDQFTGVWGIPRRTLAESQTVPDRLAKNTLYRTMADCELVLRFFAIKEALTEDRKGSLRRLLDLAMKRHKDDAPALIEDQRGMYLAPLEELTAIFGGTPFRLPQTGRPSRPLYDALMVALSLNGTSRSLKSKSTIRRSLERALSAEDTYDIMVGRGNTLEAIKQRIALAEEILFGHDNARRS